MSREAGVKSLNNLLIAETACLIDLEYFFILILFVYVFLSVQLEPHVNGPFTPDLATPVSKMRETATANGWPMKISVGEF